MAILRFKNQLKKGGAPVSGILGALFAGLFLLTSCTSVDEHNKKDGYNEEPAKSDQLPQNNGMMVDDRDDNKMPITNPPMIADMGFKVIEVKMVTTPTRPQDEQYLGDWFVSVYPIDDQGRPMEAPIRVNADDSGIAAIPVPMNWLVRPLEVFAINSVYPPFTQGDDDTTEENDDVEEIDLANYPDDEEADDEDEDEDDYGHWVRKDEIDFDGCINYSIFIPPYCADKAVWVAGPAENAVWEFYGYANKRRAHAWEASQVDCQTWLKGLQLVLSTDKVQDELEELAETDDLHFHPEALILALQENQEVLVPTRPPFCMAERRHNGGQLNQGDLINAEEFPFDISDDDDVIIGQNGLFTRICEFEFDQVLQVNGTTFVPDRYYYLDEEDFDGIISEEDEIVPEMDVNLFQVRQNNGRQADHDLYENECSISTVVQFTNLDDENQDVELETGVTMIDLFDGSGGGNLVLDTEVYLTSDGDAVLDDEDTWAILYDSDSNRGRRVITVELPGFRKENFKDPLYMRLDPNTDNLFIGLRDDYELNQRQVDGQNAYMNYTVTVWNGNDNEDCNEDLRTQVAACYDAADTLSRQFFITRDFNEQDCCTGDCLTGCRNVIRPLEAAEFAVRSQCFSNSRSQQRWQSDEMGFWNINSHHGVAPNLIVPPGWLAPYLNFEFYIQKFDEAVFKGPRGILTTDDVGQLQGDIPTLVEGDRVLLRAESSCCEDYDIILPCVPEFVGFTGAPGVPYIPQPVGPPAAIAAP